MDIAKARTLKIGDTVRCPADRGDPAYSGKVEHVGQDEAQDLQGRGYLWVTVRRAGAHASVWPSNRLG